MPKRTQKAGLDTNLLISSALAIFFSLSFTFLRFHHKYEYLNASSTMLADGMADKPFQYRVLIPWLAGFARDHVLHGSVPIDNIYFILEFVFVFLLYASFSRLLSCFTGREAGRYLALAVFYALPFNYIFWYYSNRFYPPTWYPYDIPSVFFFTLGILLIYKRRWLPYYALFAAAAFNRETSCFLTLAYILTYYGKTPWKKLALHATAQLLIWVAVKLVLYALYGANPGPDPFQDRIASNLSLLQNPLAVLFMLRSFGFMWVPALLSLRYITDDFLRRLLLICLPFVGGMFIAGVFSELRIYGELTPVILTPALVMFYNIYKNRPARAG